MNHYNTFLVTIDRIFNVYLKSLSIYSSLKHAVNKLFLECLLNCCHIALNAYFDHLEFVKILMLFIMN